MSITKTLDFEELLENVGDAAFAMEILGDFLQLSRPMLDTLQGQAEDQSGDQTRVLVHKLKGSAGAIYAEPLLAALEHLEACVNNSEDEVYQDALQLVQQQFAKVEEACRELSVRYSDSATS